MLPSTRSVRRTSNYVTFSLMCASSSELAKVLGHMSEHDRILTNCGKAMIVWGSWLAGILIAFAIVTETVAQHSFGEAQTESDLRELERDWDTAHASRISDAKEP